MEKYNVIIPFKALCCRTEFFIGQILEIYEQPSKNRLYINAYEDFKGSQLLRGGHNVKRSTFMRCCTKKEE